jgi:hypothetical protein
LKSCKEISIFNSNKNTHEIQLGKSRGFDARSFPKMILGVARRFHCIGERLSTRFLGMKIDIWMHILSRFYYLG